MVADDEFNDILSQGWVDFYKIDNIPYFGELIFFPISGLGKFEPEESMNLVNW
mgnify:CR=1 FL=1